MNKLFNSLVRILFIAVLALVILLNCFVTVRISIPNEKVIYEFSYWWVLILPNVVLFIYLLSEAIDNISSKTIYIACTIIYIFIAYYFVKNTNVCLIWDAGKCLDIATKIVNGDMSVFDKGSYIQKFPFQLGFVLYDMFVYSISRKIRKLLNYGICLVLLNIVYILIINFVTYKITNKLFNNDRINKLTIILEFMFLPLFFYFFFGYGTLPGLCLFVISLYFFICLDENILRNSILMIVFGFCSCILKQNYMIGIIAMFITAFIKYKKAFVPTLILLILALNCNNFIKYVFENIYDVKIGGGHANIFTYSDGHRYR